jgi:hypothetical protein
MSEIPKSPALLEVGEGALSISELLSRDPETLSQEDFDRQIALLRAQAERWFEAERLGLNKRKTAQKSFPVTESKEDMTDSGL